MHNNHEATRKKIKQYMICLDRPLGAGAIGKVYLSFLITNPQQIYAVKIINKKQIEHDQYMRQAIRRQFQIHSTLQHTNIVKLIDMHETINNIYIIQQYCDSTTLLQVYLSPYIQVLQKRKRLEQSQVRQCMKQICLGYSQLVKKGIIHRDLKPQNIMIAGQVLKIGDFGFAKQISTQNQRMTSIVGSPIYMAPQILRGEKYNSKCDVWSFGIMIFQMLYGYFPWQDKIYGPQTSATLLKILTLPLKIPQKPQVSQQLKSFIQQCLQTDQKQRLSWLQIFQHNIFQNQPIFAQFAKNYRQNVQSAVNLLNQLASYIKPHQLIGAFISFKQPALDYKLFSIIIKQYLIPQAKQQQLNIMYQLFDKDCNGVIDIQQFVKSFQVCDENILLLLNELITEHKMFYQQLVDQFYFSNVAASLGKYQKATIDQAYRIIAMIQYQK